MVPGLNPDRAVALRAVKLEALAADPAHALASSAALVPADVSDEGDGWLAGLSRVSGAPLGLTLFVHGRRGPGWVELDAFALATVYGQVLWDDRMWGWHTGTGRSDSAERLRELHDLALRAYRQDEALVLAEV
jgi:hypothetical protein